jgi:hypothetical protein
MTEFTTELRESIENPGRHTLNISDLIPGTSTIGDLP